MPRIVIPYDGSRLRYKRTTGDVHPMPDRTPEALQTAAAVLPAAIKVADLATAGIGRGVSAYRQWSDEGDAADQEKVRQAAVLKASGAQEDFDAARSDLYQTRIDALLQAQGIQQQSGPPTVDASKLSPASKAIYERRLIEQQRHDAEMAARNAAFQQTIAADDAAMDSREGRQASLYGRTDASVQQQPAPGAPAGELDWSGTRDQQPNPFRGMAPAAQGLDQRQSFDPRQWNTPQQMDQPFRRTPEEYAAEWQQAQQPGARPPGAPEPTSGVGSRIQSAAPPQGQPGAFRPVPEPQRPALPTMEALRAEAAMAARANDPVQVKAVLDRFQKAQGYVAPESLMDALTGNHIKRAEQELVEIMQPKGKVLSQDEINNLNSRTRLSNARAFLAEQAGPYAADKAKAQAGDAAAKQRINGIKAQVAEMFGLDEAQADLLLTGAQTRSANAGAANATARTETERTGNTFRGKIMQQNADSAERSSRKPPSSFNLEVRDAYGDENTLDQEYRKQRAKVEALKSEAAGTVQSDEQLRAAGLDYFTKGPVKVDAAKRRKEAQDQLAGAQQELTNLDADLKAARKRKPKTGASAAPSSGSARPEDFLPPG